MRRMYQLNADYQPCPLHGLQLFRGETWEGNQLVTVPGHELLMADTYGRGVLGCGCRVEITWYATDEEPQVTVVQSADDPDWSAVDWWNIEATSLEERQLLCDRLGWPRQWAEGAADHEWLTEGQLAQLRAVPWAWLDQIDRATEEA